MSRRTNLSELTPAYLIHPGEILDDELKEREISQSDFAKTIGIKRSQLNEYIKGRRDFTVELCLLIAAALQMNEQVWLNLKQNYEVDKVKIENKAKLAELDEYAYVNQLPTKFLKEQSIINDNPEASIQELRKLYDVSHLSMLTQKFNEPQTETFHRKSEKLNVLVTNLITWECLVRRRAEAIEVKDFKEKDLESLISALNSIIKENHNSFNKCQGALSDFGIKLIHVENPEKCAVDGFSFWSDDKPAIGLSLRHKRIDNFAFTLMHELGHVFLHLSKSQEASFIDVEDENGSYGDSKEEIQANRFALDHLIDPKKWDEFKAKYLKTYDEHFLEFAEENNIHPAISFGRFCFEMNQFKKRTKIDRTLR